MDIKYPYTVCNSQRRWKCMCVFIFLSKQIKNSTTAMSRVSTDLTSPWGIINRNHFYFSGPFPLANIEQQPPFWSLLFPPKLLGFPKLSHMWIKSRQCGLLTATATFVEYCYYCHSLRFSSLQKSPPEALLTTHWTPLHSLSLRPHHGCTKNTRKFFGRTNGKVSYYFFSVRAYI